MRTFSLVWLCSASAVPAYPASFPAAKINIQQLRQQALEYAIAIARPASAARKAPVSMKLWDRKGPWTASVTLYEQGQIYGEGTEKNQKLSAALEGAIRRTLIDISPALNIAKERLMIELILPDGRSTSFIEWQESAQELTGAVTVVRAVDKRALLREIKNGGEYLLRGMHPQEHGFFKKYDVMRDQFGTRLRTIYTASSLYTLLKINHLNKNSGIERQIPLIARFLLSMQVHEGENQGAFYYSYDTETKEKKLRLVTGTAAKTVFSLLALFKDNRDPVYLAAAQEAGQWLLRMQNADGSIRPQAVYKNNQWEFPAKQSFLYTGQTLSALSRLYSATSDPVYYDGALKIARRLLQKSAEQHYFVGDDYRSPNPVSTSWAMMSLLDFYKTRKDAAILKVVFKLAAELLKKQHRNPEDLLNYGRFEGTRATSGNGWITEALGELYLLCKAEKQHGCGEYQSAALLSARWLIQNTYSEENTYFLKEPEKAIGGLIRNPKEASIRTDAVCHSVNAMINILSDFKEGGSTLRHRLGRLFTPAVMHP